MTTMTASAPDIPRGRFGFNPATIIVVCASALLALGLTVLFSASAVVKEGPYSSLKKQVVGAALAAGMAFAVSRLDFERLRRYVRFVGGGAAFLLVLVLIPGLGLRLNGSRRWLGVMGWSLQVSEFAKITMVFCLAHYLAVNQSRIHEFRRGFLVPIAMVMGFAGLVILEPDFGMAALTLAVGMALLFLAGTKWRHLLAAGLLAAGAFALLVALNPNRLQRFTSFLDVEANQNGGTYQLKQAEIAFAVGGTDGAGLGQGRQQLNYMPYAQSDCILAVVGEELGLWFTLGVVALFAIIFVAGLAHLRRAPNLFQYLFAAGSLLLITVQAGINLGVVTGLLPTKGMSLPFISAGLSNLLLMGILLGILVNTQRNWTRPSLDRGSRTMEELNG